MLNIPLLTLSFFNLSLLFLIKYKKPLKNKVKTLLQENPLLNETDLYETDDPFITRILKQDLQTSQ